ncbi:MAG: VWA domain-containing protein [Acidobacteriota bacterium]
MKQTVKEIKDLITMPVLWFLISLIFVNIAGAQDADDKETLKIDTLLVNIPVIVNDKDGRNVAGLKKENFTVFQDGKKQEIEFFADEDAPMNVAILVDSSYSTNKILGDIKETAQEFIKIFRAEDKGMIASFDYKLKILSEFSSDQNKLTKAINKISIAKKSGSAMQDAMFQVITQQFADIKGRKAIIVLTDGAVGGGIVSNQNLLDTLIESDTLVYPIIFKSGEDLSLYFRPSKTVTMVDGEKIDGGVLFKQIEDANNRAINFTKTLGDLTGGKFFAADSTDLKQTFQKIAEELKKQYLVGFYPQNLDDGKPHKIEVKINLEDVTVRTKKVVKMSSFK